MLGLDYILIVFAIGLFGSLIAGMVGVGGTIVNYPLLLYVPSALGFAAMSAQEVSAVCAVQVFFTTLAGMLAYRNDGYINKMLVLSMGVSILIGSFIGGYGSQFLPNEAINLAYACLALTAAVMMFFPKKGDDTTERGEITFNKTIAASTAGLVGIVAGIVGAAGAFIIIPIMLVVLKIPTRVAIASSLAISFISSIGSSTGKLLGGHVLLLPSLVMIIASIIAAPLGAKLSKKMPVRTLQIILAILIIGTMVRIWYDVLV